MVPRITDQHDQGHGELQSPAEREQGHSDGLWQCQEKEVLQASPEHGCAATLRLLRTLLLQHALVLRKIGLVRSSMALMVP